MTQVEFHSGVYDPLRFACRLLRKAWRQGVTVAVTGAAATLQALDRELWVFEPAEFVAHLRVRSAQPVNAALQRTPVWLCEGDVPAPGPKVLVNLDGDTPREVARFERIVEIVGADSDQRQRARQRWRDYGSRGLAIRHHPQVAPS